jgi:hypothetical protein
MKEIMALMSHKKEVICSRLLGSAKSIKNQSDVTAKTQKVGFGPWMSFLQETKV